MKRRNLKKQGWAEMRWPNHGQVIIEYTVLFAIIAVVTAIATAAFFTRICRSQDGDSSAFEQYRSELVGRIAPNTRAGR